MAPGPVATPWCRRSPWRAAIPGRSARRARALLAPPIPRRLGPEEAELTAVAAPDGTSVFFCHTDAEDAASWLGDFRPSAPDRPGGGPLLTAVDHVALSQPFDYFDEAVLFYRSLLGMRPQGSQEVASPYGLVRSRAVRSPGGGIRLILNVPLLGGGRLTETAGLPACRVHMPRHLRRRAGSAVDGDSGAACARQLLRRPGGAFRARRRPDRAAAANSGCCMTATPAAASSSTSTPACSDGGCSSRSSSAAADTTATAPRTPPSGWRRSCTRRRWGASTWLSPPASRPVATRRAARSHLGPGSHQETTVRPLFNSYRAPHGRHRPPLCGPDTSRLSLCGATV